MSCLIGVSCLSSSAMAVQIAPSQQQTPPNLTGANPSSSGKNTTTSGNNTTLPNSNDNYLDDRLSWPNAIEAPATLGGNLADGYCIPAGTRLIGARVAMDTSVQQASGTSKSNASQYEAVTLDAHRPFLGFIGGNSHLGQDKTFKPYLYYRKNLPSDVAKAACPDLSDPTKKLYEGQTVYVSADNIQNVGSRSGLDYGALVVPFKMQMSGGKAFTGSSSLGGYFGYRNPLGDIGMDINPILFAGASSISTSETTGGKTTSQTVAGLSYGGGLLFRIKDSFQVGLVLGFDHVNSAQKYQYNDKPWLSFEVGYSFAN